MSEKRTDGNVYTILFAVGMVFIVGALLAFTSSSLKDRIAANKKIEKQQNILYAMGVHNNTGSGDVSFVEASVAGETYKKFIKEELVIDAGVSPLKVVEIQEAYLVDVKKEQSAAKEGKVRKLPLLIGEKDGKKLYIAPIRGKGLWDAVWGYIAMDKNMVIQGVFFDHKGETAGLGANINQRFFMDDFIGENLRDKNGKYVGVKITKSNNDPKNEDKLDNEVDAIAGATITGDGVAAMIISELALYEPYFKTLK